MRTAWCLVLPKNALLILERNRAGESLLPLFSRRLNVLWREYAITKIVGVHFVERQSGVLDMALIKRTRLAKKVGLVFRWEVFNLFNRNNFANPASDVSSPSTFGKISAMSVNPRLMQFGLKMAL